MDSRPTASTPHPRRPREAIARAARPSQVARPSQASPPSQSARRGKKGSSFRDLPRYARKYVERRGLARFFPIQERALQAGLLAGQSLVLSAPSGTGKTLVTELAILRWYAKTKRKAVYLVPLRAIANEKTREFQKYFGMGPGKVVACYGEQAIKPGELKRARCIIATYEKFDSFLRNRKVHRWVKKLGLVVIDEVHMIGDPNRGAALESLIIRLAQNYPQTQILALTATVANPKQLARWFSGLFAQECRAICSTVRPVPLRYQFEVHQDKKFLLEKILQEHLKRGSQILVFCRSRKQAEFTALDLAHATRRYLSDLQRAALTALADKIKALNVSSFDLSRTCLKGMAYHHAGLTTRERELITAAFNQRSLRVICCTTTLESGINTPTEVVVVKDLFHIFKARREAQHGGDDPARDSGAEGTENGEDGKTGEGRNEKRAIVRRPLGVNKFHQICGRAGRPGLKDRGYVYVLLGNYEEKQWLLDRYFHATPEEFRPRYAPVTSQTFSARTIMEQLLVHLPDEADTPFTQILQFLEQTLGYARNERARRVIPVLAPYSGEALEEFIRRVPLWQTRGRGPLTPPPPRDATPPPLPPPPPPPQDARRGARSGASGDAPVDLSVVEVTRDFIDVRVQLPGDHQPHYCGLNKIEGWSCDCAEFREEDITLARGDGATRPDDVLLFFSPHLSCPHVRYLFRELVHAPEFRHNARQILQEYLRLVSLFHFLEAHDFVEVLLNPDGAGIIRKRPLGVMCTRSFVNPVDLVEITRVMRAGQESGPGEGESETFLRVVVHVLHARQARVEASTLEVLLKYLEEGKTLADLTHVSRHMGIYPGDMISLLDYLKRVIKLVGDLAEYHHFSALRAHADRFEGILEALGFAPT